MKLSALVFSLVLFVLGSFSASSVSAQGRSDSMKAEKVSAVCQKVTAALNGRVTSANARIAARQTYVTNRIAQIQSKITKLQSEGANVTTLQSDLLQYTALLNKWLADYKIYVADLQAAQKINCGTSQGQFRTALATAKTAHQTVLSDRRAVQAYFKNTLQPVFKTAVESVKAMKGVSPTP